MGTIRMNHLILNMNNKLTFLQELIIKSIMNIEYYYILKRNFKHLKKNLSVISIFLKQNRVDNL
jgi:hypothetical protein